MKIENLKNQVFIRYFTKFAKIMALIFSILISHYNLSLDR